MSEVELLASRILEETVLTRHTGRTDADADSVGNVVAIEGMLVLGRWVMDAMLQSQRRQILLKS
jgi:hypothetical protein